jgi:hypothetical protein
MDFRRGRKQQQRKCQCGFDLDDDWDEAEVCTQKGLHNHINFPITKMLTEQDDPSLLYYTDPYDYGCFMPKRHWCFVGEIEEATHFLRPTFQVKDKAGESVEVIFYHELDERPSTFRWEDAVPGATLAIRDSTCCVRVFWDTPREPELRNGPALLSRAVDGAVRPPSHATSARDIVIKGRR